LSLQFWGVAVSTSNFIHNQIPNKGINNKIPYELLTNNKVDYSNTRVLGYKIFYYILKPFRTKLQNNSSPGIFLGYVDNLIIYKILDLTNNKHYNITKG